MYVTNLPDLLCGQPSRLVTQSYQSALELSLVSSIRAVVLYSITSFVSLTPLNQGKADCASSTIEWNFKRFISGAEISINNSQGTFLITCFQLDMQLFLTLKQTLNFIL